MEKHQQKEAVHNQERERIIVRTSILGIAANVFLSVSKIISGFLAGSLAITLDGLNNVSDVLSSLVTIIGVKWAAKRPDSRHPFGHGRIEYLSATAVAVIILFMGLSALTESLKKLKEPAQVNYSSLYFLVLVLAVIIKILLGFYVKKMSGRVNSAALSGSGSDALFDGALSAGVLLCAVIHSVFHINLEAWAGLIISFFIIRTGILMLRDTADDLLGKRVDRALISRVRTLICHHPQVLGAYDLILHSYGPDRYVGSVHVEIPDSLNAREIDKMEREIAEEVFRESGVMLEGIGIYAVNTADREAREIQNRIQEMLGKRKGVLETHGFSLDKENGVIQIDIILDFSIKDRQALFEEIRQELQSAFPDYHIQAVLDLDL